MKNAICSIGHTRTYVHIKLSISILCILSNNTFFKNFKYNFLFDFSVEEEFESDQEVLNEDGICPIVTPSNENSVAEDIYSTLGKAITEWCNEIQKVKFYFIFSSHH